MGPTRILNAGRVARAGSNFQEHLICLLVLFLISLGCDRNSESENNPRNVGISVDRPSVLGSEWKLLAEERFDEDLNQNWKVLNGTWTIADGQLVGESPSEDGAAKIMIKLDSSENLAIEFTAYTTSPSAGIDCSFVNASGPVGHRYVLALGTLYNSASAIIRDHQYLTADRNLELKPGEPHRITFIRENDMLAAYLDGRQRLSFRDVSLFRVEAFSGIILGSSWATSKVYFDDLRIYGAKKNRQYASEVNAAPKSVVQREVSATRKPKADTLPKLDLPRSVQIRIEDDTIDVGSIHKEKVTQFMVLAGDRIEFVAKGYARCNGGRRLTDPNGINDPHPSVDSEQLTLPGAPLGALLVRMNENSEWIHIGKSDTITAVSNGRLYFSINDNDDFRERNEGAFRVHVHLLTAAGEIQ